MSGHLFITRGDLRHLACDAILVPSGTDDQGRRGHTGWEVEGLRREDGLVVGAPSGTDRVAEVVPATEASPAVWLGHTGERGDEPPEWYAQAVREFIASAGSGQRLTARPLADDRPVLAIPLVGIGAGGMAAHKGELVVAVVEAVETALRQRDADVVLVLASSEAFAAAQQARSRTDLQWRELSEELQAKAASLAAKARADRLVLFMGAGTGIGAGLPSWSDLLDRLARGAGLDEEEMAQLVELDHRDAAAVIEQRLRRDGHRIADVISPMISQPRVSLLHQLLASLPVTEAVTTNYDWLFEKAWSDAERAHVVLPGEGARDATSWLLKLHGTIEEPDRIVLSRDDYLRFEGEGKALAGVVQAMLLTRHMLFVGYSLSDDNFHRLVHQARSTLGDSDEHLPGRFGTALTPDEGGLVQQLWADDVDFVSTATDPDGTGPVRRLAVFLDLVAAEASAPAAHLLDHTYDAVFSPAERELRAALQQVVDAAEAEDVRPALRCAVRDALAHLVGQRRDR